MKRWLTICLTVLTVWGCKTGKPATEPVLDTFIYRHYFTGSQRLLFKTRLRLAKEEFSGLLVVKETAPQTYRSVFTTETGFKIFDLSIRNGGYEVNYGVGPLEKKFIAGRLAYTIQALLLRPFPGILITSSDALRQTGRYPAENRHVYTLEKSGFRVNRQSVGLGKRVKAEARFSDFGDDDLPDSATVTHSGFPLTASFRFLEQ